ncbi:hypothetical protein QCE47_13285 [Caballeronia sp. LZ025]|uniref:hypothetical protein n=1 Tax=Caballeronia TaxID=1827195 RepID=UPI001FD4EBF6|nr:MULTISPECIES: hypothetical protein [Caballeronia]MDR5733314.1 hypothetical protein [Caballeronia sp. LZ025]
MAIVIIIFLCVIIFFMLKGKAQVHSADYRQSASQIDREVAQGKPLNQPSWLKNDDKERLFTNGVLMLIRRTSVPLAFAVRGFMSPESSAVLFALVAKMEAQGASFAGQQTAAARYIEESWNDLLSSDQEDFRAATVLEEVRYKSEFK